MAVSKASLPLDKHGQAMSALQAVKALIETINQSLDLDKTINDALDQIMELFRCRSTHVRLIDFTTHELFVAAHRGYSAGDLANLTQRRKYGEGLSAVAIDSGEVFIIEDINTDPRYGARDGLARRIGIRSFIFFPILAKGKLLGDIVIHYGTPRTYSPEEIQLFIAIGHLIGAAIEHTRSYQEKLEEIAERKRMEEALQLQEMQIRTILESTADGILAIDTAGRVIKTNQRFADLWKIPSDLLKNKSDGALLTYVLSQ